MEPNTDAAASATTTATAESNEPAAQAFDLASALTALTQTPSTSNAAEAPPPADAGEEKAEATNDLSQDAEDSSPAPPQTSDEPEDAPAETKPDAKATEPKLTPEVQAQIDKRIAREVAKRKALEGKLAELEARLTDSPLQAPTPSAGSASGFDPLSTDPEAQTLRKTEQQHRQVAEGARNLLKQARTDLDGVVDWMKANKIALPRYDEESVLDYLETTRDAAREEMAGIRTRLAVREQQAKTQAAQLAAQAQRLASERFEWSADEDDPRTAAVEKVLAERPYIQADPLGRLAAITLVDFLAQQGKPKAAPAAPAARPPKMPATSARQPATPQAPSTASKQKAAVERAMKSTNPETLAAALQALT